MKKIFLLAAAIVAASTLLPAQQLGAQFNLTIGAAQPTGDFAELYGARPAPAYNLSMAISAWKVGVGFEFQTSRHNVDEYALAENFAAASATAGRWIQELYLGKVQYTLAANRLRLTPELKAGPARTQVADMTFKNGPTRSIHNYNRWGNGFAWGAGLRAEYPLGRRLLLGLNVCATRIDVDAYSYQYWNSEPVFILYGEVPIRGQWNAIFYGLTLGVNLAN